MFLSTAKKNIHAAARATGSFTLIELLVSIGILVVLVSITVISLGAYKGRTSFNLDTSQIVALLRNAQSRAVSQDRGQGWGVQFTNSSTTGGQYALFWGTSYATSSVVIAGTLGYSSFFTDPAPGFSKTIVFAPVTGAPAGPDVVVIKNSTTATVAIISISALGLVGQTTESGLAGYWPLDEGSGTSAYDASGNGSLGSLIGFTFSGSSNWTAGKVGWALNFSAGADYVSSSENVFPGGPLDFNDTSMTIGFWMQPQTVGSRQDVVSRSGSFAVGILSGSNDLFGSTNVNSGLWDTGYAVSPSSWYYVTYVSSPTSQLMYVNGALVASSTPGSVGTPVSNAVVIGGATYPFVGIIDDVRIYNRVLSAAEVQNLFSSY